MTFDQKLLVYVRFSDELLLKKQYETHHSSLLREKRLRLIQRLLYELKIDSLLLTNIQWDRHAICSKEELIKWYKNEAVSCDLTNDNYFRKKFEIGNFLHNELDLFFDTMLKNEDIGHTRTNELAPEEFMIACQKLKENELEKLDKMDENFLETFIDYRGYVGLDKGDDGDKRLQNHIESNKKSESNSRFAVSLCRRTTDLLRNWPVDQEHHPDGKNKPLRILPIKRNKRKRR